MSKIVSLSDYRQRNEPRNFILISLMILEIIYLDDFFYDYMMNSPYRDYFMEFIIAGGELSENENLKEKLESLIDEII